MKILTLIFVVFLTLSAWAEPPAEWLRRWNGEEGRETQLKAEDVEFRSSENELFPGLQVAGFRQTDGTAPLGRIMWKGSAYSPLQGLGVVLDDVGFASMEDEAREKVFLSLLQETHGLLGTNVYTGSPMREVTRPSPLRGMRAPDESHRFQVWFYVFPVKAEEGEWREVLYYIARDGKTVRARTLATYRPVAERLNGFPELSPESFE